eukprot:1006583-Rhodomonas_salina.1
MAPPDMRRAARYRGGKGGGVKVVSAPSLEGACGAARARASCFPVLTVASAHYIECSLSRVLTVWGQGSRTEGVFELRDALALLLIARRPMSVPDIA